MDRSLTHVSDVFPDDHLERRDRDRSQRRHLAAARCTALIPPSHDYSCGLESIMNLHGFEWDD